MEILVIRLVAGRVEVVTDATDDGEPDHRGVASEITNE